MASPPAVSSRPASLPGAVDADRTAAAQEPLAIEADRVGVEYPLRLARKPTIRHRFASLLRRDAGPARFWALRELSLRVTRGEIVAVVGPNGAGKTTLLQTLAGIIQPSEGTVTVRGAVAGLLGTGAFDPELSGRENIGLFGAFLGVDAAAMRDRADAIVEFAGIGDFIDAPVRTYSQGMRARLSLSIASVIEPDVLLLDEIVSTADEEYRARSEARFRHLARRAGTIVVVTHDVRWLTEFCSRAVLVEGGRVVADGVPADLLELYRELAAAGDTSAAQRRRGPR